MGEGTRAARPSKSHGSARGTCGPLVTTFRIRLSAIVSEMEFQKGERRRRGANSVRHEGGCGGEKREGREVRPDIFGRQRGPEMAGRRARGKLRHAGARARSPPACQSALFFAR